MFTKRHTDRETPDAARSRWLTMRREKRERDWSHQVALMQPYKKSRAIWLAIVSALIISTVMLLGAISPLTHSIDPNFHTLYIFLSNSALLILLYLFNFWMLRMCLPALWSTTCCFLGTMVLTIAFSLLTYHFEALIYGYGHTSNNFPLTLISNITAGFISFLISLLLNNVTQRQRMVLDNEHLQAENMLTRYQALQQQVRPHFLFNSLNTLDGLIGSDDKAAHKYLEQLATNLRYAMQQHIEVTLDDELGFTNSYIYLMQIRYGSDYLHIDEHIDPSLLSMRMAPISLQLLVENAIKHNIISARHPLTVSIATTPEGNIRVSNPIQPRTDSEDSTGIGLDNLSMRYRMLFHREISIVSDDNTFTVELPLIQHT